MSAAPALRPRPGPLAQWATDRAMGAMPLAFAVLRAVRPIARFSGTYLVTRADDVREVFREDDAFGVPYQAKLDVVMGGRPFILGLPDGAAYRRSLAALRRVVRPDDLARLAARAEAMAEEVVARADGRLDVVDALVRRITFDLFADYLGVPPPAGGDLDAWVTRLFEYVFVADDAALRADVATIAPALRRHLDGEIARRRSAGGVDDVLGRCLARQAAGDPDFDDDAIRTGLLGLIVGGPPQPPMVLPQAMEQLLRRPAALAGACAAARSGDDDALAAHVAEAMRFDPIAPWFTRRALGPQVIAEGTPRRRAVPAGATVLAAIASAMRDGTRVPDPRTFDADRTPDQYLHFGYGVHRCFGLQINRATLHRMLKPLLKRPNLRRARGRAGRLRKRGPFASSLVVEFD